MSAPSTGSRPGRIRPDRVRPGLLVAVSGWFVWAACFAVLYGVQGLGCHAAGTLPVAGTRIAGVDGLTLLLAAIWMLHLAVLAGLNWRSVRNSRQPADESDGTQRFMRRLARFSNVTATAATIWIGFPILVLPPCG